MRSPSLIRLVAPVWLVAAGLIASSSHAVWSSAADAGPESVATFAPVGPARVLDTRSGGATVDGLFRAVGRIGAGRTAAVSVAGRGVVAPDATALMLNVTAVAPSAAGFLTMFPCGGPPPLASSVNFAAGETVANAVFVGVGDDGRVCVFARAETDVVIDVLGQLIAPTADGSPNGGPAPVTPARVLDTRAGRATVDGSFAGVGRLDADRTVAVRIAGRGGVAPNATAVFLNVTAVSAGGPGFLTVFPCGSERPLASNVNYVSGQVVPNAVLVGIGEAGRVCVYTKAPTDLLIDVTGHVVSGATDEGVVAVRPARLFDSRPTGETADHMFAATGRIPAGSVVRVPAAGRGGMPDGAPAVMLNVTAVEPSAVGFLTVFPCGAERPVASNVNYTAGTVVPNAVFVGVGRDSEVCIFSKAETDVLVDLTGFVTGPPPPVATVPTTTSEPVSGNTISSPATTITSVTTSPVTSPSTTTTTSTTTATTTATTAPPVGRAWSAWVTSPTDTALRLAPVALSGQSPTDTVVVPDVWGSSAWLGVGAALTDSSVELLAGRPDLLDVLYSPDSDAGARLNLMRLPLSGTDFSTTWWSWTWDAVLGQWRPPVQAIAAADVAAYVADRQPDLSIVGVPWSAPATMKTTGVLAGGALRAGQEAALAGLLATQADWVLGRGLPLDALTVVNEPGHSGTYPTMTMTDAQLAAVGSLLDATLDGTGVDLWAVDHNWSDRSRVDTVLALAPGVFARAAFHCYGGEPSQMIGLGVPSVVTECTGTDDGWVSTFRWDAAKLVMGSIEAGSTGLMMWNLALDEDHGPKRPGGCSNCRGLITIDDSGDAVPTPEFYALAHVARAADPGATIGPVQRLGALTAVTFLNAGGEVGILAFNDSGSARVVRLQAPTGEVFTASVPAYAYLSARLA